MGILESYRRKKLHTRGVQIGTDFVGSMVGELITKPECKNSRTIPLFLQEV